MTVAIVDLQNASEHPHCPTGSQLKRWTEAALQNGLQNKDEIELCIRIVDEADSQALNAQYRGKDKPTNVLSFPFEAPAQIELNLLGDLIICAPVVAQEAMQQHKRELAHWAHMVVHGVLHLQAYDHIEDEDAKVMEQLEIEILSTLGFDNPYQPKDTNADL